MDSLQQQVLSLLSEDWKSRVEIVRETGASEHEVQVTLNELKDQIEETIARLPGGLSEQIAIKGRSSW